MPRYRAGIMGWTGRGDYGHGLDLAFTHLPDVEVVALSDPDPAGRAAAAARCGAPRTYASPEEMLAAERLELVAVAPRHADTHERLAVAAASRGAHLFCEKPLAASLVAADRIIAACEKAGVKGAIAHQNRAFPAPRRAKEMVAAGAIGRLWGMRAFGKLDHRAGGEDLMVLGTHMLDLMRFFAGDARWAHARVTQGERDAGPEDIRQTGDGVGLVAGDGIVATYGFDRGVTGSFASFPAASGGHSDYFRIELHGTGGVLSLRSGPIQELFHCPEPLLVPGRAGWKPVDLPALQATSPPPADGMHAANQALVRELLEAVERGREPVSSLKDGRASLEMIMAVYVSHFRKARVSLPLESREHPLEALHKEK